VVGLVAMKPGGELLGRELRHGVLSEARLKMVADCLLVTQERAGPQLRLLLLEPRLQELANGLALVGERNPVLSLSQCLANLVRHLLPRAAVKRFALALSVL